MVILAILKTLHDSSIGGHTGVNQTIKRIQTTFWWKDMSLQIKEYVSNCLICQQVKSQNIK